jgi:hypothetical protein
VERSRPCYRVTARMKADVGSATITTRSSRFPNTGCHGFPFRSRPSQLPPWAFVWAATEFSQGSRPAYCKSFGHSLDVELSLNPCGSPMSMSRGTGSCFRIRPLARPSGHRGDGPNRAFCHDLSRVRQTLLPPTSDPEPQHAARSGRPASDHRPRLEGVVRARHGGIGGKEAKKKADSHQSGTWG